MIGIHEPVGKYWVLGLSWGFGCGVCIAADTGGRATAVSATAVVAGFAFLVFVVFFFFLVGDSLLISSSPLGDPELLLARIAATFTLRVMDSNTASGILDFSLLGGGAFR